MSLGGGVLVGTTLERTRAEGIDPNTREGASRFLRPDGMELIGGQYGEVGLGVAGIPVDLRARVQSQALGFGTLSIPFFNAPTYRIDQVLVSAVATF